MEKFSLHFPRNFLWGAASAAYQIEGGEQSCLNQAHARVFDSEIR